MIYKEHKKVYWLSIAFLFFSICLLIAYVLLIILDVNTNYELLCGIVSLIMSVIALVLLGCINRLTAEKHLKIQHIRLKVLKKYYKHKNFNTKEIKIINELLERKMARIEKQKVTVIIILGTLVLPIWEIFLDYYFDEFTMLKMKNFIIVLIMLSFIILFFIRMFNRTLYLYEENIYIRNNISIIENIIYLNKYIIQEREEKNDGRRRR